MKPPRVFVVGDTHFGHRRITEWRPYRTVEEHDADIIARWNSVVRKQDIVWHLGDVYFRDGWQALMYLNGEKRLVLGNHDHHPTEMYQRFFTRLYGMIEYRNCLLSHMPAHPTQFNRFKLNVHGHCHAKPLDDQRYRCVSLELINYTPVLFDKVIQ